MTITMSDTEWLSGILPGSENTNLVLSLKQALKEMEEQRREQHRASMVVFRQNRKDRQKRKQAELVRLEREMELAVVKVRAAASCTTRNSSSKTQMDSVRELIVERELLQTENRSLREEINRHEMFHQIMVKSSQEEANVNSVTMLPQRGWTVQFEHGEPPFQFHPLTREDYDVGIHRFDANISSGLSSLSTTRTVFGWEVHSAPLEYSSPDNKSIMVRARLTKRVQCPLTTLLMISYTKDKDISPTVITPIGWSIHQRHTVSTQMLQEFDPQSCVFVHNIPGPDKHLRYVYLVRRAQWLLPDGRRRLTLSVTIANLDASHHSRDADTFNDQVEWVTDGGIHLSVTEVDEASIDVVCDRFAGCQSKEHAQYAMVHWIQFANWWEQLVSPATLLL